MSFQPVVPMSGYVGWRFLQRTLPQQTKAFNESFEVKRDVDAFRDKIKSIRTAEDLVSDRQMLRVALGAFGLESDLNNKFFIQKILEEGTSEPGALANRLADSRYKAFSKAMGFNSLGIPRVSLSFATDDLIERYEANEFQKAVGNSDANMRLALNVETGVADVLKAAKTDKGHWFQMMGTPPLRAVFETAMGFPASFGALDLDKQLEQFKTRANSMFGTDQLADFADGEEQEKLIRLFMVRKQAEAFGSGLSAAQTALTLISNISYPRAALP